MSTKGVSALRVSLPERWQRVRDEQGVALMSAILFMLLLGGMSLVLLSIVLGQVAPGYLAQKSTKTVNAAQAGLQAALGIARSATTTVVAGQTFGNKSDLPCSITGNVDATSAESSYAVTMNYFAVDPTGKDSAWMTANKINCTASGPAVQPTFAVFTSEGKGTAITGSAATYGNRSVTAIYKFRVTNVNVPGGLLFDSTRTWCLEAVNAVAGSQIKFVPAAQCVDANKLKQLWIYDTDYEIKLASTTVTGATELCITGPILPAGLSDAVLKNCISAPQTQRWNQLWNWSPGGDARFVGQNQTITGSGGYCLGSTGAADLASTYLRISGCTGTAFSPSPSMGAGAASFATNQIVNFKQFGRCADVTDGQVGKTYMIAYPCKQDPTNGAGGAGAAVAWNHKWTYVEPPVGVASTGTQRISVNNGSTYCLQAPVLNASPAYVKFETCTGAANQKWIRNYDTGSANTSFTFVDSLGRCLTVDPLDVQTVGSWSKMIVAVCNGLDIQKWNAPATYNAATFGSYKETSG